MSSRKVFVLSSILTKRSKCKQIFAEIHLVGIAVQERQCSDGCTGKVAHREYLALPL
jgi:hypothetical protein